MVMRDNEFLARLNHHPSHPQCQRRAYVILFSEEPEISAIWALGTPFIQLTMCNSEGPLLHMSQQQCRMLRFGSSASQRKRAWHWRRGSVPESLAPALVHMQVDANLALVGFDAEKNFDAIVSADLFERLKPAPDIFLAAAKQVPPQLLSGRMRSI